MFRRLWTGLPEAPKFPMDLEKLGYFINNDDEIRSRDNPNFYFKYFLTKNTYWNDRQRFSFNAAVQQTVLSRLAALGVRPVRLPLGAADDEPHVLVMASDDLATARRIVLFAGETSQDLGILAHRVCGGPGGVSQGSLVPMVMRLRETAKDGEARPAILILNPGELFWWPEGRRSLSLPMVQGMPRPSAAHLPPRTVPLQNTIPHHHTAADHVASVFRDVLAPLCRKPEGEGEGEGDGDHRVLPRVTAIAIAGGADALEAFLDEPEHWARWGPHMESLALLGGLYEDKDIKLPDFKGFLRMRGRAYIASPAPVDTPLAGPDGNDKTARAISYGCPVHSAGTSWLTETMFIDAQEAVLAWGETVARDRTYANPQIAVSYADKITSARDQTWADYDESQGGGGWGDEEKDEKDEEKKTESLKEDKDDEKSDMIVDEKTDEKDDEKNDVIVDEKTDEKDDEKVEEKDKENKDEDTGVKTEENKADEEKDTKNEGERAAGETTTPSASTNGEKSTRTVRFSDDADGKQARSDA